jgi:hypothetical protein
MLCDSCSGGPCCFPPDQTATHRPAHTLLPVTAAGKHPSRTTQHSSVRQEVLAWVKAQQVASLLLHCMSHTEAAAAAAMLHSGVVASADVSCFVSVLLPELCGSLLHTHPLISSAGFRDAAQHVAIVGTITSHLTHLLVLQQQLSCCYHCLQQR